MNTAAPENLDLESLSDGSIEHEAGNSSDKDRVVKLFEIRRLATSMKVAVRVY